MSRFRAVAFDLDDTLAESKARISNDIGDGIKRLLEKTQVCIISGGHVPQFEKQVLGALPADANLHGLHLMPTCGTRYLRFTEGHWIEQYSNDLTDDEKQRCMTAVENVSRSMGLWGDDAKVFGDRIEDRGSQITYSALGQLAPIERKRSWDPQGSRRLALRDALAELLPDLEVRVGGSTSIDITRRGIDKAYGIRALSRELQIPPDEIVFVGDRLSPGGNDFPVIAVGVRCVKVDGPGDTVRVIDELLSELDDPCPMSQLSVHPRARFG